MLKRNDSGNEALVVDRPGTYLTKGGLWLVIGLSMLVSPISGCAPMSEDHKFYMEVKAERLAEWEEACRRAGGVVWSTDGRDRTKKCVSKKATRETLARIASPT